MSFRDLPDGTLGREVVETVRRPRVRVARLPPRRPSAYLAQHDFVHVLADYGTNLKGELEVFAFIGRADPDPKGFAWLATLIGLFETGFIADTGFFEGDVRERNIQSPGMHAPHRRRDPARQGRVRAATASDLFDVDYYAFGRAAGPRRAGELGFPPKSRAARSRRVGRASSTSRAAPRSSGSTLEVAWQQCSGELHPDRSRCAPTTPRGEIVALLAEWDRSQATSDVMGYMGTHVLADRDEPGHYLIVAEFGVVDPDVPAADEAEAQQRTPRDAGVGGAAPHVHRGRADVPALRRAVPHRAVPSVAPRTRPVLRCRDGVQRARHRAAALFDRPPDRLLPQRMLRHRARRTWASTRCVR